MKLRLGITGIVMICIKHTALLVYFLCGVVNIIATDLKQIQRRIERERQVEKIKNEIMKNLGSSGIWINRNDHYANEDTDIGKGNVFINKHSGLEKDDNDVNKHVVNTNVNTNQPAEPEKTRNPIISIGEPFGKLVTLYRM